MYPVRSIVLGLSPRHPTWWLLRMAPLYFELTFPTGLLFAATHPVALRTLNALSDLELRMYYDHLEDVIPELDYYDPVAGDFFAQTATGVAHILRLRDMRRRRPIPIRQLGARPPPRSLTSGPLRITAGSSSGGQSVRGAGGGSRGPQASQYNEEYQEEEEEIEELPSDQRTMVGDMDPDIMAELGRDTGNRTVVGGGDDYGEGEDDVPPLPTTSRGGRGGHGGARAASQNGSRTGSQTGGRAAPQTGSRVGSQTGGRTGSQSGGRAPTVAPSESISVRGTRAPPRASSQTASQTGSTQPRSGKIIDWEDAMKRH